MRSISKSDDLLGAMWAVIATVFVYRYTYEDSATAALSRMSATLVGFALCLAYLLILTFTFVGMASLIGLGNVVVVLGRRPGDAVTVGIATAVVMVVAALNPAHQWEQPILRLIDTVVGVAVSARGREAPSQSAGARSPAAVAGPWELQAGPGPKDAREARAASCCP